MLSPAFSGGVTKYTATTTNNTNTINATAVDPAAKITIRVYEGINGSSVSVGNGTAITWTEGLNTVEVFVQNEDIYTQYEVSVTKS